MKRIAMVTDVWLESTNGVVSVLKHFKEIMEKKGVEVVMVHPGMFGTKIPLITYPEIKLAIMTRGTMEQKLKEINPDYIHIATQGTLGLIARLACTKNNWKFTTFYHTQLPTYVNLRFAVVTEEMVFRYLRWFHKPCASTIVATPSMKEFLESHGFKNIVVSPFGIDIDLFKRNEKAQVPPDWKKPIFTFLGRVAVEKDIQKFLDLDLPGTKVVIGDGPQKAELEEKYYGAAIFTGYKKGQELVDLLSVSDVFVCPSKTDTFGMVVLEAMACGVPVAAFDVLGPRDIITNGVDGYLGDDLGKNARACLELDRKDCRKKVLQYSWDSAGDKFIEHQVSAGMKPPTAIPSAKTFESIDVAAP